MKLPLLIVAGMTLCMLSSETYGQTRSGGTNQASPAFGISNTGQGMQSNPGLQNFGTFSQPAATGGQQLSVRFGTNTLGSTTGTSTGGTSTSGTSTSSYISGFGTTGTTTGTQATNNSATNNSANTNTATSANGQTGRNSRTSSRSSSRFGSTGQNGFGQNGFGQGGFNLQQMFGQSQQQPTGTVRPALRLGFTAPTLTATQVGTSAVQRFENVSRQIAQNNQLSQLSATRPALSGVSIDVADGGIVTLRGQVESVDAARLAANMLRMEPGVRSVKNELTVVEPAAQ